jgi:hypothetical protein
MGEVIACLEGLKLYLVEPNANLVIETDRASILDVFKDDSIDRSTISQIARDFRLKKPPDRQVILAKISRGCNAVAHDLCQLGRRVLSGGVLQGAVPTCASNSVLNDCNKIFSHKKRCGLGCGNLVFF